MTADVYDHPGALLPYQRSPAGRVHHSPCTNSAFVEALDAAPALVLVPTFRSLGDSLFLLAFANAYAAYRTVRPAQRNQLLLPRSSRDLTCHLLGPDHVDLSWFDDTTLYEHGLSDDHAGAALITDGRHHIPPGSEAYRIDATHAYPPRYIEHHPDTGQTTIHSSLTARYALWFEELVGITLPLDPDEFPPRFLFPTKPAAIDQSHDRLNIGVTVTASAPWKNYDTNTYLDILTQALPKGRSTTAHVIHPPGASGWRQEDTQTSASFHVVHHHDLTPAAAGALLAWCDLVIGNDTGMSHLAATSNRTPGGTGSPVIIPYARYDHEMWTIGPRIHPVATATATHMRRHNRAQVLTTGEWRQHEGTSDVSAIPAGEIAAAIRTHLPRPTTDPHPWDTLLTELTHHRDQPPPPTSPDNTPVEADAGDLAGALHGLHASLWALEDQTRDNYDNYEKVGQLKHQIDLYNQHRHHLIERLDAAILRHAPRSDESVPVASETPAMMVDRLAVLTVRIHHLTEANSANAAQAVRQWTDLHTNLNRLLGTLRAGAARCRTYQALKDYGRCPTLPGPTHRNRKTRPE